MNKHLTIFHMNVDKLFNRHNVTVSSEKLIRKVYISCFCFGYYVISAWQFSSLSPVCSCAILFELNYNFSTY